MVSKSTQHAKKLTSGGASMMPFLKKKRSRAHRRAAKRQIEQLLNGKDDAVFAPNCPKIAAWELC